MSTTRLRIVAGYHSVITTPLYLNILEQLNPYSDWRLVTGMIVDLETSVLGKDVTVYAPVNRILSPNGLTPMLTNVDGAVVVGLNQLILKLLRNWQRLRDAVAVMLAMIDPNKPVAAELRGVLDDWSAAQQRVLHGFVDAADLTLEIRQMLKAGLADVAPFTTPSPEVLRNRIDLVLREHLEDEQISVEMSNVLQLVLPEIDSQLDMAMGAIR